jgi:histidyl-tRNA synthetase
MALPGFRDFYPDDCAFRNAIFAKWREVAHRYGFVEYDGPPLEPLDLFTKKSGDEIVTQLYNFKDKGERDVALRPEMTPTLARLVTARHKDFKKPLKWFSVPQVFRYERQQKGRLKEHYQLNCDIIGEASLEADVELIALVIDVLRAFGLTEKDFVVRLSDRQFWTDFMDAKAVPEDQRYAFIQAIDKSEREDRAKTAEKLGPLAAEVFAILDDAGSTKSERLNTVETGLRHRGLQDYIKRDYTVVRGLAYYTGVVFEVFDRSGEFRAIAGGGRYDNLLKNLGGVDLPALGFGIGDVVLGEILKAKQSLKNVRSHFSAYVVIADESYRTEAIKIVQRLRDANYQIEYPMTPMKIGKQLQTAEEKGCGAAFIIDAKIQNGLVDVKNLADRTQSEIYADKLDYYLRFEHTLQRERLMKESSPVRFERYKRDILNRAWALTEDDPEQAPPRSEHPDEGK